MNGHQAGDRALAALAVALQAEARTSDICCRVGGDEFAVILRQTSNDDEILGVAERIRCAATRIPIGPGVVNLSVGASVTHAGMSTNSAWQLIERADMALYDAKTSGRSRIVSDREFDRRSMSRVGGQS